MVLHHGQSIAHSSTPRNPQIHVSSPFWAFFCARGAIIPPQPEKREREGSQAARRRNFARAPPPERGKAGATWLKLPTTARRVQRVSSLAGVACVEADPARRRPEHNVARSCGLDALAAPPSFPRASGVGRAAVASCWCVLRWRQGLRAFARRACRLRSGGNFARVFALCVPPCRFAVGVLLPGGPQPKARANPRLWPTAPALRLLRLADGLFCAGRWGYGRSAAASCTSKRVSARPQRLFSACQGVIGFFEPMCRVFSKVECVRCFLSRSCARGSGPTQTRAALALVRFGLACGLQRWPSLSCGRCFSRSTGFPRSAPSWWGALLAHIRGYWGSLSLCACLRAGSPRAGVGSCGCFVARGHPSRCSRCSCAFSRCVLVCRRLGAGRCRLRSSGRRVGPLLLPKRFPGLRCGERRDALRNPSSERARCRGSHPTSRVTAMIPGSRREWVS